MKTPMGTGANDTNLTVKLALIQKILERFDIIAYEENPKNKKYTYISPQMNSADVLSAVLTSRRNIKIKRFF